MEIKVYKIWDTERQLFFKGGQSNTDTDYGNKGKTWNELGHVKNCLRAHCEEPLNKELWNKGIYKKEWVNNIPESWEVVEISSLTGKKRFKAKDLYPK